MSFHRWIAGFVLLLFMLSALFLNAVMFSARSFQHYIGQIAPETGGIIQFADIRAAAKATSEADTLLAPLVTNAAKAEATAASLRADLTQAQDAATAAQGQIMATVDRLESDAGRAPPGPTSGFDEVTLRARLDALAANRTAPAPVRAAVPAARAGLTAALDAEAKVAGLSEKLEQAERDQVQAGESVTRTRASLVKSQAVYGDKFDRVVAEARALENSSFLGIGRWFAEMHPAFLSTILACSMGALGAILYLFPLYMVPNAKVWIRDIVVRLAFGMATALAFYIVANATLAGFSLSSPNQQAESVGSNLNPFTVSLLGIIAGVMATDIAHWILERGRQMLGGNFSSFSGGSDGGAPSSGMPVESAAASGAQAIDPNTGRPL